MESVASPSRRQVAVRGVTWTRYRYRIRHAFWVPDRLGVLPLADATRRVTLEVRVGGRREWRTYDLSRVVERERAYADLMIHGDPHILSACLNGPYLVASWHRLVLPWAIERTWQPVIGSLVEPWLDTGWRQ